MKEGGEGEENMGLGPLLIAIRGRLSASPRVMSCNICDYGRLIGQRVLSHRFSLMQPYSKRTGDG